MLLVLAFIVAQAEPATKPTRSAVTERLIWIGKHQQADGRLGLGECDCFARTDSPPVARDPEVEQKMKPLVATLNAEGLEERERALCEIARLGRSALPYLEDATGSRHAEVRGRATVLIARLREPPGLAADVESTSLTLLALSAGGYSHPSHDVIEGVRFGEVIKKSLQWLVAGQTSDGAVGPVPADGCGPWNAQAAFAFSEMYGMTATQLLREPAEKAVRWLVGRQRESGAWGPGGDDLATTYWSMAALVSARLSDLAVDQAVLRRGLAWLGARAKDGSDLDAAAFIGFVYVIDRDHVSKHVERVKRLAPAPDDPFAIYVMGCAVSRTVPSQSAEWSDWCKANVRRIADRPLKCELKAGRRTILETLALTLYYR